MIFKCRVCGCWRDESEAATDDLEPVCEECIEEYVKEEGE